MSFGRLLDNPFRESGALPVSEAVLYPISLDGWGYMIDRKANTFVRRQVPILKTQPADPGNPNQTLLIPPEIWRRNAESWHQGAGQMWGDRLDSLPYRFDDSMGLDCWSKWRLSMLPTTNQVMSFPTTRILLDVLNGQLLVAEGIHLWWKANLAATPVVQSLGAEALSLTVDGEGAIIALANGSIVKCRTPASLVTLATLPNVNFVYYVKDHLIAAAGNALYDVSGITDGSAVIGHTDPNPLVHSHPLGGFRWVDATGGLSSIYLLGGAGDRWVVHRVNIKTDATGLDPPIVASPLQDGEVGYSIESYMGYVFVGSQHGLRFGVPETTGDLTLGPLVPTKGPVRCFEGQENFVWYGNPNPDVTHTGLGRLDLRTFTLPLTPAYANDLMAPTAMQGDVYGAVTAFDDHRVFSVAGHGVYVESALLVDEGWLREGGYSFGVVDKKVGLYSQIRFAAPLVGRLEMDFRYDDPAEWVSAAVFDSEGPFTEIENAYLNGVIFVKAEPRFTLLSNATHTAGPQLSRWELRVVPQAGKANEWVLPLVLHDVLNLEHATVARDVQLDLDRLLSLVETTRVFSYREGHRSWMVNALDYEWHPQMLSERVTAAWQGVFNVKIREIR